MKKVSRHSENIEKWLKLSNARGVGPILIRRLLNYFNTLERILGASVSQLCKVEGIGTKTAEQILRTKDSFNVEKELEMAQKLGVSIISIEDPRYPPALAAIDDPPTVLYVKGSFEKHDSLAVAIVGTRRCSIYGREQASRFAHILASSGFTIVSGMARGVDTAAHTGALSAKGRTIAVQGCGLNKIFPPENKKLFHQIGENGCCVSELPFQYEPRSENFPARNRIIAGLSMGTIVIEAGRRSGALLSAKASIEYNREVMAVPGRVDSPINAGSHQLIKDGASLVDSIEDVMETLGYIGQGLKQHTAECQKNTLINIDKPQKPTATPKLSENENAVYQQLDSEPIDLETLIKMCPIQPGSINASLISLRLKGLIRQMPGNMFKKL